MKKSVQIDFVVVGLLILLVLVFGSCLLISTLSKPRHQPFPTLTPISSLTPFNLPTQNSLPTSTPWPTYTTQPTFTAGPTFTSFPTSTNTVVPTYTKQPTYTPLPTYTFQPTYTLIPTQTSTATLTATATATTTASPTTSPTATDTETSTPTQTVPATFTTKDKAFCYSGPSDLVWWENPEKLNKDKTFTILGKSTAQWGSWWLIKKNFFTECWVNNNNGTTVGDTSSVPEVLINVTPTPTVVNVTIKSKQENSICKILVEPSGSNNWTEILNGQQLQKGEEIGFNAIVGRYDIQIFDCSNVVIDSATQFWIDPNNNKFTTP